MSAPAVMQCPSTDLDEAAIALAVAIGRAEVELNACVLPRTKDLVAVAEAEGVTAGLFSHEDCRLIWSACDVARDRPLVEVLRLARRALQEEHHWDPKGPFGTGSRWSDETLVQLAESYPPCPAAVRAIARNLVALYRRWTMAEDLLARSRAVLTGDDESTGPIPLRRRPPVVTVTRRRGGAA